MRLSQASVHAATVYAASFHAASVYEASVYPASVYEASASVYEGSVYETKYLWSTPRLERKTWINLRTRGYLRSKSGTAPDLKEEESSKCTLEIPIILLSFFSYPKNTLKITHTFFKYFFFWFFTTAEVVNLFMFLNIFFIIFYDRRGRQIKYFLDFFFQYFFYNFSFF